jgi:hypothetical protein
MWEKLVDAEIKKMITHPAISIPELSAPNKKYFIPASADPSHALFQAASIYSEREIVSIAKYITIKSFDDTNNNIPNTPICNSTIYSYSIAGRCSRVISSRIPAVKVIMALINKLQASTASPPPTSRGGW